MKTMTQPSPLQSDCELLPSVTFTILTAPVCTVTNNEPTESLLSKALETLAGDFFGFQYRDFTDLIYLHQLEITGDT